MTREKTTPQTFLSSSELNCRVWLLRGSARACLLFFVVMGEMGVFICKFKKGHPNLRILSNPTSGRTYPVAVLAGLSSEIQVPPCGDDIG